MSRRARATICAVQLAVCAIGCGRLEYAAALGDGGLDGTIAPPLDAPIADGADAPASDALVAPDSGSDGATPDPRPLTIDYRRTWLVVARGRPMTPLSLWSSRALRGPVSAVGVVPGLSVDPVTGTLSGTPTTAAAETSMTVDVEGASTSLRVAVAEPFVVDTLADLAPVGRANDGVCETASASCSLRAALAEADGTAGAAVVLLGAGTYALDSPLTLRADVAIVGLGEATSAIDSGDTHRVLYVELGAVARLSDVAIRNGRTIVADGGGGCIRVDGTLWASHVEVSSCWTPQYGGGIGVSMNAELHLERALIADNESDEHGGGVDSTVDSRAFIDTTTFLRNRATLLAGGLQLVGTMVSISRSTFIENSAPRAGGVHASMQSITSIENCTFVGNSADNGAAIETDGVRAIRHCTFVDNTALVAGAAIRAYGGTATLEGNAIARSTVAGSRTACPLAGGGIASGGHNLVDATCAMLSATGDRVGIDVGLAATADGDALPTVPLLPGSPALEGGAPDCALAIDERGLMRPFDEDGDGAARCDCGAREGT